MFISPTRVTPMLIASFVLCQPARAAAQLSFRAFRERVELGQKVRKLAFDPATYFRSEYKLGYMVTIAATGDDYEWPLYSVAVFEGCEDGERGTLDACSSKLTARMVRAPTPPVMARERERGSRLIFQLAASKKLTKAAIGSQLTRLGLEWKEANLRSCPPALAVLEAADRLSWVPSELSHPTPKNELSLVIHSDSTKVIFRSYGRVSIYDGYKAEGTPAEWADKFAAAVEGCWRPSQAPRPWMR